MNQFLQTYDPFFQTLIFLPEMTILHLQLYARSILLYFSYFYFKLSVSFCIDLLCLCFCSISSLI